MENVGSSLEGASVGGFGFGLVLPSETGAGSLDCAMSDMVVVVVFKLVLL